MASSVSWRRPWKKARVSSGLLASLPPAVLAIIVSMVLLVTALGALLYHVTFGPRARLERRIAALAGIGARKAKVGIGAAMPRRRQVQVNLKDRDQGKKGYLARLRDEIAQAGMAISPGRFLALSALLALAATAVYLLMRMPPIGAPFFLLTAAIGVPKAFLRFRCGRRVKKFVALFPDALDIIVRGIRSGLPVGECINVIGREMPEPVGSEFRLIGEAQRLGVSLDEALRRTTERVPNPELRFFAIVLLIQQQTGGNLADTLAKLSDVLRQRKRMRDKVQAMSSEAKASAVIIGSLPVIVSALLSVVSPEYIALLFTTTTGHLLIGIGLGIMSVGIFVMRQMINFEI